MSFKDYRIPTNFKMPKGYTKRFLFIGESVRMEIEAEPPKTLKMKMTETGRTRGLDNSKCLDWIQEAVETIRYEVGAP